MPASSKSQQRLMGMVHAYNNGELKDPPQIVLDIAGSMKKKDTKDFAGTKHKGLPEHKKKKGKKKKKKASVFSYLLKLANELDDAGLIEEADIVDHIMERIHIMEQ